MAYDARSIAHAYFQHWTEGRFDDAIALFAEALTVEVPINTYPTRESFAQALVGFGALVSRAEILVELGDHTEAIQLYDMEVTGLGSMRVAEHFTVHDGKIVRLRQIHDTAALRAAGYGP
jgi:ketosteroid isomerase-like protein